MFQRHLMANVRDVVVPKAAQAYIGMPPLTRIIAWMEAPDGRFGADPIAGRDALLIRSLSPRRWRTSPSVSAPTWRNGPWALIIMPGS